MNNTVSRCKSSIVNPVLAFRTLAVLAFVFAGSTARASLIQWSGNGHWYEAIPASIAWTDAKAAAEAKGGYLATITSAAENTFVAGIVASSEYWHLLGGNFTAGPWLGGFQPQGSPEPAGNWQWVTGETWSYSNWTPEEPNNGVGGTPEDALLLWKSGSSVPPYGTTWNDGPSSDAFPSGYIIEYIPEPASLSLFALGAAGLLAQRRTRNN